MLFTHVVFSSGLADKLKYLDPGSGSLLIQLLIAGLAGIGLALGIGWKKIKGLFSRRKDAAPAETGEDEEDD
jgi:hypothetical protein